jgi:NADH pyrophosphatase NudC (nudix superfamily)
MKRFTSIKAEHEQKLQDRAAKIGFSCALMPAGNMSEEDKISIGMEVNKVPDLMAIKGADMPIAGLDVWFPLGTSAEQRLLEETLWAMDRITSLARQPRMFVDLEASPRFCPDCGAPMRNGRCIVYGCGETGN